MRTGAAESWARSQERGRAQLAGDWRKCAGFRVAPASYSGSPTVLWLGVLGTNELRCRGAFKEMKRGNKSRVLRSDLSRHRRRSFGRNFRAEVEDDDVIAHVIHIFPFFYSFLFISFLFKGPNQVKLISRNHVFVLNQLWACF